MCTCLYKYFNYKNNSPVLVNIIQLFCLILLFYLVLQEEPVTLLNLPIHLMIYSLQLVYTVVILMRGFKTVLLVITLMLLHVMLLALLLSDVIVSE